MTASGETRLVLPDAPWLERPRVLPAARNPARVYIETLADSSREVQRAALVALVRLIDPEGRVPGLAWDTFPWQDLRYAHVQYLLGRLRARLDAGELRPATVLRYRAALRRVLREAWRLELLGIEDYHRAIEMEPIRHREMKRGRELSPGEIELLFGACLRDPESARGARDALLLSLLYGGGLRRREAVTARFEDLRGDILLVHGKGRADREVPLAPGTLANLEAWLPVRGRNPGPLLTRLHRGGAPARRDGVVTGMSTQGVAHVCRRRGDEAGLVPFSPHDLRRSVITHLLRRSVDPLLVALLVGHKDPKVTAGYDRRGFDELRRALGVISVPAPRG